MRNLLLLIPLFLTGCLFHVYPSMYQEAEKICNTNGGVHMITSDIEIRVYCNNGLSARLPRIEQGELK